jgi:phosphoribosyl 1,2-cyclic phosphodiesterase
MTDLSLIDTGRGGGPVETIVPKGDVMLDVLDKTRFEPTGVAPDTFLIHDHQGEGEAPVSVALNTMVILAAEPVVIDTGMAENREQYLADVFALVEPEDIRWVFISHDDVDHTGNVNALMEAAPNATLVINWFMTERMGSSLAVPPTRWRWVGDGEYFDVGTVACTPSARRSSTPRRPGACSIRRRASTGARTPLPRRW